MCNSIYPDESILATESIPNILAQSAVACHLVKSYFSTVFNGVT